MQIYAQQQQSLATDSSVLAEAEFLPITFDNIDLLISSHLLERSHYPQQVLREIDRVLMPDGHCFLIGFNPFSYAEITHGIRRKLTFQSCNRPYHAYSAKKISDWLNVLGFEIINTHSYDYRPNFKNEKLFKSQHYLELAGMRWAKNTGRVYLIHAKKTEFSKIATDRWQLNKLLPRKPAIALASKQGNK
jgi:ubiquinone/menaquinone biosynthesis C-methylase UbiE